MQHVAVFEEQVPLTPRDMRSEIASIDKILGDKVSSKLEGRCSRHGYVLPGTVKILSRSMGMMEKARFTGNVLFHVQAEGEVLNPPNGSILEGDVFRKNKMGMYVSYEGGAIRVIVPRDLYIGDQDYESIGVGDKVKVEVKKSRFQVNDEYILSAGYFRGLVRKGHKENVEEVVAAKPSGAPEYGEGEGEGEAEYGEGETEGEGEAEGEGEGDEEAAESEGEEEAEEEVE